ncbi:hypothetical protein MR626_13220 [bacterium]|nr:hypothetical protein [bacterium]
MEALHYAQEQDEDDRMFQRWIGSAFGYQSEVGFDDFKRNLKQQAKWGAQTSDEIVSNIDTMMEGVTPPLGNL